MVPAESDHNKKLITLTMITLWGFHYIPCLVFCFLKKATA